MKKMTPSEVVECFEKNSTENFLEYDLIDKGTTWSKTMDATAFSWMNYYFPQKDELIRGVLKWEKHHSLLVFDVEESELQRLSEQDVILLLRCGVFYCKEMKVLAYIIENLSIGELV